MLFFLNGEALRWKSAEPLALPFQKGKRRFEQSVCIQYPVIWDEECCYR